MKLAVIVTLGPLDKYGYQHTSQDCLRNLAAFSDRLYLIRSRPGKNDIGWLLARNNVTLISAPVTWFQDGHYDIRQILFNEHVCLERARVDGCDAAAVLSCNWYIPKQAGEYLRGEADGMLTLSNPYGWVYGRYQVGEHLTGASVRYPLLVNLRHKPAWVTGEGDGVTDGIHSAVSERKDFSKESAGAVVDTGYEITIRDLNAKMRFVRCYNDWNPKRRPDFTWKNYWHDYYRNKLKAMPLSSDAPEGIGADFAARTRADFIGSILWKELGR